MRVQRKLTSASGEPVALTIGNFDGVHRGHQAMLARLIEAAEVVIESSRPRALEQLGIDAHAWIDARPGRIWISITGYGRGDPEAGSGTLATVVEVLRLCVVTDAFFAQVCYRGKAACQAKEIPLVPRLLHRLAMRSAQVCIGDPVVVDAGVYIPHGQVVLDALTRVRSGTTLSPFVTLGRVASRAGGPDIGHLATIGTGAKVLGPVKVGARASIGANAVVPAEAIGVDGDSLEAEAWAYLAVRSLKGLPITFPGTTGVARPLTGGVLARANA